MFIEESMRKLIADPPVLKGFLQVIEFPARCCCCCGLDPFEYKMCTVCVINLNAGPHKFKNQYMIQVRMCAVAIPGKKSATWQLVAVVMHNSEKRRKIAKFCN